MIRKLQKNKKKRGKMIQEVIKLKNTEPVHIMRKRKDHACCNETEVYDNESERRLIENSTMFGNLNKNVA